MVSCVGEIDGLFVKVHRPSMKDECWYNRQEYFLAIIWLMV
jgi:hypothetical protein